MAIHDLWDVLRWTYHDADGYNIFSGPLADITLFTGATAFYLKHTCHTHMCFRMAKHPVDGTPYSVCKKHHPEVPDKITPEHIKAYANRRASPRSNSRHGR